MPSSIWAASNESNETEVLQPADDNVEIGDSTSKGLCSGQEIHCGTCLIRDWGVALIAMGMALATSSGLLIYFAVENANAQAELASLREQERDRMSNLFHSEATQVNFSCIPTQTIDDDDRYTVHVCKYPKEYSHIHAAFKIHKKFRPDLGDVHENDHHFMYEISNANQISEMSIDHTALDKTASVRIVRAPGPINTDSTVPHDPLKKIVVNTGRMIGQAVRQGISASVSRAVGAETSATIEQFARRSTWHHAIMTPITNHIHTETAMHRMSSLMHVTFKHPDGSIRSTLIRNNGPMTFVHDKALLHHVHDLVDICARQLPNVNARTSAVGRRLQSATTPSAFASFAGDFVYKFGYYTAYNEETNVASTALNVVGLGKYKKYASQSVGIYQNFESGDMSALKQSLVTDATADVFLNGNWGQAKDLETAGKDISQSISDGDGIASGVVNAVNDIGQRRTIALAGTAVGDVVGAGTTVALTPEIGPTLATMVGSQANMLTASATKAVCSAALDTTQVKAAISTGLQTATDAINSVGNLGANAINEATRTASNFRNEVDSFKDSASIFSSLRL